MESESHTTEVPQSRMDTSFMSFVRHCPGSLIKSVQTLLSQAFKWVFVAQIQMPSFNLTLVPQPNLQTMSPLSAEDTKNVRQKMIPSHLTLTNTIMLLSNGLRENISPGWGDFFKEP